MQSIMRAAQTLVRQKTFINSLRMPLAVPAVATQARGMKLSPREVEHLTLSTAGALAQRRLARGVRLNHPEAVALLSSQMMERIRDGTSVGELMSVGKRLLGWRQVLAGVPKLISNVQIEVRVLYGRALTVTDSKVL